MVVVPIFGGYDLRRTTGRLWDFDVTGGRYEEREYVATGSGSLHAGTVVKLGYQPDLDRDTAIDLVCRALWEAADADSATGGPDALRGIYPVVAEVTAARVQASARQTTSRSATRRSPLPCEGATNDGPLHCVPLPRRPLLVAHSLALARSHGDSAP